MGIPSLFPTPTSLRGSLLLGIVQLRHFSEATRQRCFNYTCKQTQVVFIPSSVPLLINTAKRHVFPPQDNLQSFILSDIFPCTKSYVNAALNKSGKEKQKTTYLTISRKKESHRTTMTSVLEVIMRRKKRQWCTTDSGLHTQ